MAKKEIRTKYIKSLVADKEAMAKVLEESTKESLTTLLDESVNKSLRQMLAESDDDSYEEEVATDQPEFNPEPENSGSDDDVTVDLESGEGGATGCEDGECAPETEGSDVWDSIADCKDCDGEYDLRGKDIKTVLNVIKSMSPGDGLRFIKNDDDTATVETDDGDSEFVIDITGDGDDAEPNEFENGIDTEDGAIDSGDGIDTGEDGEGLMDDINLDDIEDGTQGDDTEIELELGDDNDETQSDDDMVNEGNVNLGYTDNYQSKSPLTMPTDKGEGEGDSRFDDGAPKGGANNKKRWVGHNGQNGGNPYSKKTKQPMTEETDECGALGCSADECNEDTLFEVVLEDGLSGAVPSTPSAPSLSEAGSSTSGRHGGFGRGVTRKQRGNEADRGQIRNGHHNAEEPDKFRGTGDGYKEVSESRMTAIERQYNAMLDENKELKAIAAQIKQQLNEAVLINASLAKVIKLVTENATSRDEKINILNRFNKVQSLSECKNLYNQISGELKSAHKVNNSNLLDKQLSESKGQNQNLIIETNMLNQSEDLTKILDLNERLMRLGKK